MASRRFVRRAVVAKGDASMSIAITGTRRVHDGLYAQVSLGGDAKDCLLVAHATIADSSEVPVRVLRADTEGEWLLALPSLSVTQTVELTAVSWDGTETEHLTQRLNPIASRLSSPMDLLRRGAKRVRPQVPSERDALGEWEVVVDRLVATNDGYDVCHGHATLMGAGRQSVEGALSVCMLDSHGTNAARDPWICLSDAIDQVPAHPGFFERRVEFSLRVATAVTTMVVWVRPEGEGELPTGFVCLGPRVTTGMRELWRVTTTCAHDDEAYDAWFAAHHVVTPAELAMQQDGSFDRGVTFSVVSVLHDASADTLRAMVDSVLEQSYGHLELVLVNSVPDDRRLASVVRGLELADARVRSVPLGADFGIAAATSEGIDAATGDYVCLLDEGDLLAPDALWCLARAIDATPDADLLYTDEDCVDRGRHLRPCFKPDWDPDLLMGGNYLGGLMAVRAELLRDMETMGRELDGAQAYYVALHASAQAAAVCHVPRVLYHRRRPDGARAAGTTELASGLAALRAYVELQELPASVRPSTRVQQSFELSYEVGEHEPLVSVIIVNHDGVASLDRCLASLREHTTYGSYEVIIVEHGSVDPETFAYYRKAEEDDSHVRTIFYQDEGPTSQARLVNFGASRAKGAYLLLLAPDVEAVDDGWMTRLVSLCARPGTEVVGGRLVRADGTIVFNGAFLSSHGPMALDRYRLASDVTQPEAALLHRVTLASGSCMMVDATTFRMVGGFSVAFDAAYGDADLCLRVARGGGRVVLDPQVSLRCYRPFAADGPGRRDTADLRAVGHLWESWPYGPQSVDPTMGPNLSHLSDYRVLAGTSTPA